MKKIATLVFVFFTSSLFAEEIMNGCQETKLNEAASIYSCASGDYMATFKTPNGKRDTYYEPEIKVLATKPPQIIQTQSK